MARQYKNPLLAAILNLIFPGIGYLYIGGERNIFGILLTVGNLLLLVVSIVIPPSSLDIYYNIIVSIPWLIIGFAFAFDAYKTAQGINKRK